MQAVEAQCRLKKSGRGISRLASIGRRGSPPWHVRTTREVDPSREGQLDMVGVFNLCRARPRQMTMGRVVSPLLAALVVYGLLRPSSFSPRALGSCQSRDEEKGRRQRC